jgi:hypothetical protein
MTHSLHRKGDVASLRGDCLEELGLRPHTVQLSLGYFGRTDLLPNEEKSVRAVQNGTGIIQGSGTAEIKTNDVKGNYRLGEVGFTVDVGWPAQRRRQGGACSLLSSRVQSR